MDVSCGFTGFIDLDAVSVNALFTRPQKIADE